MSIELKNVSKQFGDVTAVAGVSFSAREGELTAFLGPSGGGKTTVLRMIAGLETATTGEIFIHGGRVNDIPAQKRNIGFVFQNYALFKNMTVFNNIAFGLKVKKWKRTDITARVAELCRLLGIAGLEKRYPHELSGGQRQRVAIARALAPRPAVLLLDEPFGAVDAKVRQELREWLVQLHHDLSVTTLFVTHDQEEALEVSDRVVIFSRGHLEQVGPPREIYERPANEFVATFVGAMNVLQTVVRDGVARAMELEFSADGLPEGSRMRIGFRPNAVLVSADPLEYQQRAVLRHAYFLGPVLRLELELISGLTVHSQIASEEFIRLGLAEGQEVSLWIGRHHILARDTNVPVPLPEPALEADLAAAPSRLS